MPSRRAGVTVPLFSLRTNSSWGIGEISDLAPFGRWMRETGLTLVQVLPLNEISGSETSPYASLSAFGIDPMFVGLDALPEFSTVTTVGTHATALEEVRRGGLIAYDRVRPLKLGMLRASFDAFETSGFARGTQRGHDYESFCARERDWLEEYALFRAIKDATAGQPWWRWPAGLRDRHAVEMQQATERFARDIAFYRFAQFVLHDQWQRARGELAQAGVSVMGDLPFMVARDSADVWANQSEFRHDANVGAPPDQFDEEGQDWGLPPYKWEAMTRNGFRWLRRRARYSATLFDCFRIDHVVGFFRTFVRRIGLRPPAGKKLVPGEFYPKDPSEHPALGEAVMRAMAEGAAEAGANIIAEDLGIIPDFVRTALRALKIPGYRVLRWEKDGSAYRDPANYPALSVACFGTHDTESVAAWWETLDAGERRALTRIPALANADFSAGATFDAEVHAALLGALMGAGSDLVLLLAQDVFASADRINTPGTIGTHNWTWRLPDTIETLRADARLHSAMLRVKAAITAAGRAG